MLPAIANIIATYVIYRFITLALRRFVELLVGSNIGDNLKITIKAVEFGIVALAGLFGTYNVYILIKAIDAAANSMPSF